ncbi:MAG: HEAT repeat domain-containing protein [Planctomycetota bacterium]
MVDLKIKNMWSRYLTISVLSSFCCCLGGCSESPEKAKEREVIQWIKRWPPPSAGVEPLSDLVPYSSEEEWINAGRKIQGIEKILVELCDRNPTEIDPYDIICSLSYFATAGSLPVLIRIVEDEDRHSSVRRKAATILGQIGDPAAVQPLCGVVSSFEGGPEDSSILVLNAILGLNRIGDANAIPVIENVLRHPHFDPGCKETASRLLDELRKKAQ